MKVVRIRLSFVTEPLSKYTTPPSQLTTKFVVDLIRTERYIKVYTFTLRSCNSSAYIRRITENCKMVFAESGVCTKLSSWQCSTESGFELCFFCYQRKTQSVPPLPLPNTTQGRARVLLISRSVLQWLLETVTGAPFGTCIVRTEQFSQIFTDKMQS